MKKIIYLDTTKITIPKYMFDELMKVYNEAKQLRFENRYFKEIQRKVGVVKAKYGR